MSLVWEVFGRVAPVFLVLALGRGLRQVGVVDAGFVERSSRVVFHVGLPALIFRSVAKTAWHEVYASGPAAVVVLTTLAVFVSAWVVAVAAVGRGGRGAFVQAAFRGNSAVFGLAVMASLMGAAAVPKASFLLAFLMPLYSVLAVVCLSFADPACFSWGRAVRQVGLNPIFLASVLAVPFSLGWVVLPGLLDRTLEVLAGLALPLALLGLGAGLEAGRLRRRWGVLAGVMAMKLVVSPLVAVALARWWGLSAAETGMLFVMAAAPTAVASFPMAVAMGGDTELSAAAVVSTTVGSVLTVPLGWSFLRWLGWV